jgi:inorganic pyrophosphatase
VPRGSFLKRGLTGRIDFVSPLPCPFNYGAVPSHLGLEGDLLDALVLVRVCASAPAPVSRAGCGHADRSRHVR